MTGTHTRYSLRSTDPHSFIFPSKVKQVAFIKLALKSRERAKIKRAIDRPEQDHSITVSILNVRFRLYY